MPIEELSKKTGWSTRVLRAIEPWWREAFAPKAQANLDYSSSAMRRNSPALSPSARLVKKKQGPNALLRLIRTPITTSSYLAIGITLFAILMGVILEAADIIAQGKGP